MTMRSKPNRTQKGFTIVELLIVIVVIAILAAISIVAYTGIQQKARDTQRKSDISSITKALELYYIDKGYYPPGSWAYSDGSSWDLLLAELEPYATGLPKGDPINERRGVGAQVAHIYSYFTNTSGSAASPGYCGATGVRQMYIITYRFESSPLDKTAVGECTTSPLQYTQSWYRSSKL